MDTVRTALIIGIDHYDNIGRLDGCAADAEAMERVLQDHGDGDETADRAPTSNFECTTRVSKGPGDRLDRDELRDLIEDHFRPTESENHVALLYFAGHGHQGRTDAYLLPSDARGNGADAIAGRVRLGGLRSSRGQLFLRARGRGTSSRQGRGVLLFHRRGRG